MKATIRAGCACVILASVLGITAQPAWAALKDNICQANEICWRDSAAVNRFYDNNNGSDSDLSSGSSKFYPAPWGNVQTNNSFNSVFNNFGVGSGQYVVGYNTGYSGITTGGCVGPQVGWNMVPGGTLNTTSAHRPRSLAQC